MGRCFVPDVLAGIMDRAVADLDGPLEELVENSILFPFDFVDRGYYDFRHQLLRDALYDTVPGSELRRLHARAGEFGAELVGASEIHASLHFERAGLRAQAFRAALAGARAASAISSRRESFELYRRALANLPDDLPAADRAAIYAEYADAAGAVDDMAAVEDAARHARRSAQEAGDAVGAAAALAHLFLVARRDVRPRGERLAILDQAEFETLALPPSPRRAAVLLGVRVDQAMLAMEVGRLEEARARLKEARALVREAGDPDIDMEFYGTLPQVLEGDVENGLRNMLDIARRARDGRLESSGVTAYRTAAWLALRVMDYATAEAGIREGLRYADEIQQSYCRSIMAATSAHCDWAAGRWDEAVRTAELELVAHTSRRAGISSRDALAYVALGRGMVDRARRLLDDGLVISRPSGEVELILPSLWGHAEAALIAGEPGRALSHCEEALELARGGGERAHLVPFVVTGVRAALAERRPEAAERWLEAASSQLEGWAELAAPAIAHAEGLIRLAAGTLVAARSSLEAAVAAWDARGRIWEATWARVDLATALLRSNRYVEANRLIGEVEATASALGSAPLKERAADLARQARGRGSEEEAWYPLTVREFEVARAIAEGKTNAEIAAGLFVSPKTVSAHVEHILAKLGAGRRAEIASWVSLIAQPVG
jgi:DNA-binding CsgD family transcriptional regulator/tetratricopeptide (TPR) repeat protein